MAQMDVVLPGLTTEELDEIRRLGPGGTWGAT